MSAKMEDRSCLVGYAVQLWELSDQRHFRHNLPPGPVDAETVLVPADFRSLEAVQVEEVDDYSYWRYCSGSAVEVVPRTFLSITGWRYGYHWRTDGELII